MFHKSMPEYLIYTNFPNLTSFVFMYWTRRVSDFPLLCFDGGPFDGVPGQIKHADLDQERCIIRIRQGKEGKMISLLII